MIYELYWFTIRSNGFSIKYATAKICNSDTISSFFYIIVE
jgi:hypothetical protein